ncbi:hypothetical protein [Aeromicrobium sp.]|uniref:hypothetical protein n=1 Tax=Aeromicrobium sp. TaxID=1871063 RepID=UPI0019C286A9|nr:hypothetical protein [Aeromicrobium sp.]MBC7630204.1 hypothetical protein [Aeromicrobium sp.]
MRLRFALASVLAPLLVVVAVVAGGWWASGKAADTRSSLTSALDSLPADTAVAGFTDWSSIRRALDLGSVSTASARESLAADALTRDLSTRSVIGQFVQEMHRVYGWSAADVDWESYGQAPDGAVMVAKLDDSLSMSTVRDGLRRLGYVQDGDVWNGGPGTAGKVGSDLAATLASVALVPRQRIIVASNRPAYVSSVLGVVDRHQPSLLSVRPAADVAAGLVGLDSVLMQRSSLVCESTGVKEQGPEIVSQAKAAVTRAGGLEEPTFSGRGIDDGTRTNQLMRFVMSFGPTVDIAGQLRARTALATGPFIGRSGRVEDSLDLTGTDADSSTLTMRFDHDPDSAVYMTGDGPLLFAGCGS